MSAGGPSGVVNKLTARAAPDMQEVRQMLDSPLRVGLTDGRIIVGRFACLDKQRNILLTEARESRSNGDGGDGSSGRRERHLGTVLVPRQWQRLGRSRCEATRPLGHRCGHKQG
eukprot:scaffold21690_cov123-Isochrysis_galbana.AAC.3